MEKPKDPWARYERLKYVYNEWSTSHELNRWMIDAIVVFLLEPYNEMKKEEEELKAKDVLH